VAMKGIGQDSFKPCESVTLTGRRHLSGNETIHCSLECQEPSPCNANQESGQILPSTAE